jgi:WD40 repeat protein
VRLEKNLLRACWDSTGEKIAAASGDQTVLVWDARTGKLLYKLPGHRGCVNDVRFSPHSEPLRKYLVSFYWIAPCTSHVPGCTLEQVDCDYLILVGIEEVAYPIFT